MSRLSRSRRGLSAGLLASLVAAAAFASPEAGSPGTALTPLPSLNVPAYMGTWYQVAWFPNRFQQQCVSDTTALYRQLPGGEGVEVTNRCRLADGKLDPSSVWRDRPGRC
jgi:apolipoprotein D and lipocalin family protein